MKKFDLIATSTAGLEAVVSRELKDLGYAPKILSSGRIAFEGTIEDIIRTNIWLRCADRVLISAGSFAATDFGQLFDGVYNLPWETIIGRIDQFPVRGRSWKSQLSSVPACQKIVKKAVAKRLIAGHKTNNLPECGSALFTVEVALAKDIATITIDTTGAGLNKRGYRDFVGHAPIKETLAAAMVQLSYWRPDRQLVDPFCGSGTIPIEAAMIERNIAPGLKRKFAFEDWTLIPASLVAKQRKLAEQAIKHDVKLDILASDIDRNQIGIAKRHAKQAGVLNDIKFQVQDFADLRSNTQFGCIITNPPYGERLDNTQEIKELYQYMPAVFRNLKTWSFFLITSFKNFEKLIGQPADRRRKLYNGRLECTYFQFHGPRPPKTADQLTEADLQEQSDRKENDSPQNSDVKTNINSVFGGIDEHAHKQAEMFVNRLKKQARHLRKWPNRGITCYRLYDKDIPEIPLAVDWYDGKLHIAEYERPTDRTPAKHADWLDFITVKAAEALDVPQEYLFVKRRMKQKGSLQYEKLGNRQVEFTVRENDLNFKVNLSDYLDTGLFLDHRITRKMFAKEAFAKRVLNLFAYTGSFSVYAANANARSVTTVDLSNTYLDWAEENFELNNIPLKDSYKFVRDDTMKFLEFHKPGKSYDLAIVDPPTFSNSKRNEDIFDVQRDYIDMLNRLITLMSSGGVIYFSNNFKRFKFDESKINASCREISKQTVPEDFRNKRIHRCWRIVCP